MLLTVIVAPGTTAFVGSVIVPASEPVEPLCAKVGPLRQSRRSAVAISDRFMDYPPKFGSVLSELWNMAKLSGVASLREAQPVFRHPREQDFCIVISGVLLDL